MSKWSHRCPFFIVKNKTAFLPQIILNNVSFSDLTVLDSGLYTCQAKSRSGQAVWSASLEVADPNLDPTVTFNSMPYLSQFPASPSKPQLVNATSTSITLSWDKPHRIGGSALQGYQVGNNSSETF